ncbi:response regulator transcription factor [uncultured Neptuniibacter sp.]|uniref:response regulator transcription factor n=1 Tax=uncultured Neptuniibacter sp. TaxID=502143 RepID=UPI0026117349|nr:response regulator transcription factor [uncultured Neptuniibacter sp.]
MKAVVSNDIVLVVDDSPDALSLINDALEGAGMDVLVALEGKQALTIANRIRPDIILLDAIMPNMDGFETCRALKADPALATIPVIFMTGLTDTSDLVRGLEVGGVDYLTKPINPSELLARMKVHLNNARQAVSVQSALDSSGQYLMTLNQQGELIWGTPQVYALLAKAGADERWREKFLPEQLSQWVVLHEQADGKPLKLLHLAYPLELEMVTFHANGEFLVRLVDGNRLQGAELLRDKLAVTERESEVLHWVANGKTNREIAEILEMSPRTVNKHLEQIFPKLGVENRTAAAGIAIRALAEQ